MNWAESNLTERRPEELYTMKYFLFFFFSFGSNESFYFSYCFHTHFFPFHSFYAYVVSFYFDVAHFLNLSLICYNLASFFFFFLMCWFFFLAARHLWSNLHDQGLSLHPLHCMAVFTRGLLGKSHDQVVLMSCIDYNFIP